MLKDQSKIVRLTTIVAGSSNSMIFIVYALFVSYINYHFSLIQIILFCD